MATFYLPVLPGPYSPGSKDKFEHWMQECPLSCLTRQDVVEQIASGQFENPARVLEIDEAAGTVRDVTAAIAGEVGDLSWRQNKPPFPELRDWLERHHAPYLYDAAE
jgi:hypothetical protein